jgi:arginase
MTRILVPYHLDEFLPDLDVPFEADETVTVELPDGDVWARMSAIHTNVADAVVRAEAGPLVMTGDCTAAAGVLAGLQRRGVDPAIVWFDAHGDVQTLETTASGYIGGMALRFLMGYRPDLVGDRLGLRPVAEDRVVLVDGRDLDPPERDFLASSNVRHEPAAELTPPDGPIYLHLDLDVVDPDDLPGLRFPTPGGPPVDEFTAAVRRVIDTGRVEAVLVGCTWHGGHGAALSIRPHLVAALGSYGTAHPR